MDFFYPLPNQGTLANGYGVFQQFVPKTRNRHRADLRLDHEASENDSLFLRGSYQHRDPNSILFEVAATRSPTSRSRTRKLDTASAIGGLDEDLLRTIVNEFRVGYNYDNSRRESTFQRRRRLAQLGLETPPSLAGPSAASPASGSRPAPNRPTNIADQGRNVDRTLSQNSFSISDNFSWITGGHSLKAGGLWTRNTARDGFGIGVNHRGRYDVQRRAVPAMRSPTSSSACRGRSPTR